MLDVGTRNVILSDLRHLQPTGRLTHSRRALDHHPVPEKFVDAPPASDGRTCRLREVRTATSLGSNPKHRLCRRLRSFTKRGTPALVGILRALWISTNYRGCCFITLCRK